jgi:hypothetical protein
MERQVATFPVNNLHSCNVRFRGTAESAWMAGMGAIRGTVNSRSDDLVTALSTNSCRSACCHCCATSDTRVEGAAAGSRKSTTRSDLGILCSIPMRY